MGRGPKPGCTSGSPASCRRGRNRRSLGTVSVFTAGSAAVGSAGCRLDPGSVGTVLFAARMTGSAGRTPTDSEASRSLERSQEGDEVGQLLALELGVEPLGHDRDAAPPDLLDRGPRQADLGAIGGDQLDGLGR